VKASWGLKSLGELVQFRGGGTPDSSNSSYWGGDIAWVSPKDIKSAEIGSSIDHITAEAVQNSAASLIPSGSILIVVRSGILARTVPMGVTTCELVVNQDIKALCQYDGIDRRFLHYFLLHSEKNLLKLVTRSATVHRLSTDNLRQLKVPLPPLSEQQRIVAILDEAFEGLTLATANAEKNLRNARELVEITVESATVGADRPGWVEARLGEICTTQYGLSKSMNSEGKGYKIFRMGEIQRGRAVDTGNMKFADIFKDEFELYRLRKGDVLFNRTNSFELVGKTGLFDSDGDYCFASYLVRVIFDPEKMDTRFACYTMNANVSCGTSGRRLQGL